MLKSSHQAIVNPEGNSCEAQFCVDGRDYKKFGPLVSSMKPDKHYTVLHFALCTNFARYGVYFFLFAIMIVQSI